MTDLLTDLGKVAGVLAFLGYIPYLMSIVRRKTLPNPATWWIWSIMGGILLASYYVAGNREAIWVPLSYFIGPTVTAILSVKYGRNEFGSFERYCLGGAAVSLLLWWISGPIVALTMLIMIDLIAIAPTLRKTYFKPTSEDPLAWSVFWLANTINLYVVLASASPTYAAVAYPFELFLLPTSIMCLVIRGRVFGPEGSLLEKQQKKVLLETAASDMATAKTNSHAQTAAHNVDYSDFYDQAAHFQIPELGDNFNEDLTSVVRQSARKIIARTVAVELNDLMSQYSQQQPTAETGPAGPSLLNIENSLGPLPDSSKRASHSQKNDLPPLPEELKTSQSMEKILVWLCFNGVATESLSARLTEVLAAETIELSPSSIEKIKTEQTKAKWQEEYQNWNEQSLSRKRYAYLWIDSLCINGGAAPDRHLFSATGVSADGYRELLGMVIEQSSTTGWHSLLLGLKKRNLQEGIQLAVSDGGSEVWSAFSEIFPTIRQQQCWNSKIADVLKKLPKKLRDKAKDELWEVYRSETKEDANQTLDEFIEAYQVKYYEAAECLTSERDKLLSFYAFPAEHWRYLYSKQLTDLNFQDMLDTTNGAIHTADNTFILPLFFQLAKNAQKQWPRMKGFRYLGDVIEGASFDNGVLSKFDVNSLVDSLSTV